MVKKVHISAIVPVYNNEATLKHVVQVLQRHKDIDEVIMVDDGSTDTSADILMELKHIQLISHARNLGKGAGIAHGWERARGDVILTVDADLADFSSKHIDRLLATFLDGGWDMVIASESPIKIFDWVSGQRIYRKHAVLPFVNKALHAGNGIEQIINYAHRGKRVRLINGNDVGHILKYQRHVPHIAAWLYVKEGWQLVRTEYDIGFYSVRLMAQGTLHLALRREWLSRFWRELHV